MCEHIDKKSTFRASQVSPLPVCGSTVCGAFRMPDALHQYLMNCQVRRIRQVDMSTVVGVLDEQGHVMLKMAVRVIGSMVWSCLQKTRFV